MKKSSTILKHVRKLIENGDHKYICYAIEHLEQMGKINWFVARRLKNHVMDQLGGLTSYGSWIRVHHGRLFVAADKRGWRVFDAKLREGRLAWIDHMIAEFKKKGD